MTTSLTVEQTTADLITAYIAMRAAQDHITVTQDTAVLELVKMGKMVKSHGNRFAP